MKCFKKILTAGASLAFACTAFANNKADQLDKQIRELKQQIEAIESRQSLDKLDVTQAAEGKVNEWLTLSGYIEQSFLSSETDDPPFMEDDSDSMSVGIVDLDFSFDFGDGFTAFIDVTADGGDLDMYVEQAWGNYEFGESGFSLKFGRQDVGIGLEANEAVDLYQFSVAFFNELGFMPSYAQGLTATYATEKFAVRAGVYDGLWGDANGGGADDFGYQLGLNVKPIEGLEIDAAYAHEDEEDGDEETDLFNIWLTYAIGEKFEVAAEYAFLELDEADVEYDHFILRGTYKINDKWSVTVRWDHLEDDDDLDVDTFIISPAVQINEHLLILAELGIRDGDYNASYDLEQEWIALEAFITF